MLQYNSKLPDVGSSDLFVDQLGDGAMAPVGPSTQTAPHMLVQTSIQPQPHRHAQTFFVQTPAQPQMVMIMPAITPSQQFIQNQTPSTALVHNALQHVSVHYSMVPAVNEGKRRKTHSINEKHYRASINDKIQELHRLLDIGNKMSKAGVLQKTIDYIESLKQQIFSLQQENLTLKMADQNNSTFENLDFNKWLEQMLEEFFVEKQLFACGDDGGVNNVKGA